MLSYMIPGEDRAPPGSTPQKGHLQLRLEATQISPVLENMTITTETTRRVSNPHDNGMNITTVTETTRRFTNTTDNKRQNTNPIGILNKTIKHENGVNKIEKKILKTTNNNNTFIKNEVITNLNNMKSGDDRFCYVDGATEVLQNGSGVSSPGSDTAASQGSDRPKLKLLANGGKQTTLKRVSFGSSKGSMVETLVFESPTGGTLPEEPDSSEPQNVPFPFPEDLTDKEEAERSKVRVSFFQSSKPQCISPPPPTCLPEGVAPNHPYNLCEDMSALAPQLPPTYDRQISTESGWDNPFRPDGDLSREADEIVNMIRGGKPITPVASTPPDPIGGATPPAQHKINGTGNGATDVADGTQTKINSTTLSNAAPTSGQNSSNGTAPKSAQSPKGGAAVPVEVQRSNALAATVTPQTAEHVVIKKKPKCKCCVLQ